MNKLGLLAIVGALSVSVSPAFAQSQGNSVNTKAREKVHFYNAPREIQILDERPVVHDFREAPTTPNRIKLPPGPGANPGAFGGGGAGALGGDPGTIPDGTQVGGGGGDPGYRTPNDSNPVPLDHGDFGHRQTNIPAGGMVPKGFLPAGYTTGVHSKLAPPSYPQGQSASANHGAAPRRAAAAQPPAAPVAMYSPNGSYGPSSGGNSGNGGASTSLIGKLLKQVPNK